METNCDTRVRGGAITAVAVIALGAWAALAPFVATNDEARAWSADGPALIVISAVAAAVGGLGLLGGRRRVMQLGGLLALSAGLVLLLWPIASVLSTAGDFRADAVLGDPGVWTPKWMVFFCGTGAMIALISSCALGWLDPLLSAHDVIKPPSAAGRPTGLARCGSRRRSGAVRRTALQRERLHVGARGRKRSRRDP